MHARLHAIKSLQVYFKMSEFPDLCFRLEVDDFEENLKVEIVSPNGSINAILYYVGEGILSNIAIVSSPPV